MEEAEQVVRRFFDVMNRHDDADLPGLFTDSIEMVIGPETARGIAEVRQFVLQDPPDLRITSEPEEIVASGDHVVASFQRLQFWRASGELAVDESLWAAFTIANGRISRAELLREPPPP